MTFEEVFMPHLDAAYNLARWLTRNEDDAQDLVQEAYLRALRFFDRFQGTEGRPWLLTIVRNTFYTWSRNKHLERSSDFEEALCVCQSNEPDPEMVQVLRSQHQLLTQAIENLPFEFREIIILRELEEFSYKEIAAVTGIPIGTVMSRLARARTKLQRALRDPHPNQSSERTTTHLQTQVEVIETGDEGIKEMVLSI